MRLNLYRVIADRCCGVGVVGCCVAWLLTGRGVIMVGEVEQVGKPERSG